MYTNPYQGRTIDVLKVDIEGSEYGVIDNSTMWQEMRALQVDVRQVLTLTLTLNIPLTLTLTLTTPRQVQLELHLASIGKQSLTWKDKTFVPGEDADQLMRVLTSEGFAIFHKEVMHTHSTNPSGALILISPLVYISFLVSLMS